jgi:FkbM family methyltransferase
MISGLSRCMTLRAHDYRIHFDPSAMALAYFIDSNTRLVDHEVMTRLLAPGATCIDIGANIGTTTIPAARAVGVGGRVVAVEAHPTVASYLRRNIALNGLRNVKVHACAIDARPGIVQFADLKADDTNRIVADGAGIDVPARTLDDIAVGHESIDLLKIDVEGAEMRVLRGGNDALRRTAAIYVEIADVFLKRLGSSAEELVEFLRGAGFHLYSVSSDLTLQPMELASVMRHAHSNVLGLRKPATSRLWKKSPSQPERGR